MNENKELKVEELEKVNGGVMNHSTKNQWENEGNEQGCPEFPG